MDFFKDQMDYIYFFNGLSFIILFAVCFVLRQDKEQRLPWVWLGLFGLTRGVLRWLDILTVGLDGNLLFNSVRLLGTVISLLFLIEFGRAGILGMRGKGPGLWIFGPLLLFTAMGGFFGLQGVHAFSRYALATGRRGIVCNCIVHGSRRTGGPLPQVAGRG